MKLSTLIFVIIVALGFILPLFLFQDHDHQWVTRNGKTYWYENNTVQGTENDPKNLIDPATGKPMGREIYVRSEDAWYWLDATDNGARAHDRDIKIPYIFQEEKDTTEEKWVHYGSDGKMLKGWQNINDKYYYFQPLTGQKYIGTKSIDGTRYFFNNDTGELESFSDTEDTAYEAAILIPSGTDMHVVKESIRRDQHDTFREKIGYTRHFSKVPNVLEVSPEDYALLAQSENIILLDVDNTKTIYIRAGESASEVTEYYRLECNQNPESFYITMATGLETSPGAFPVQCVEFHKYNEEAKSS